MGWGTATGDHFVASNPAFPGLPQTNRAAGMLARNWPLSAGIPQLIAGGQEIQITIAPTGIPASVAANTTANVALTGITGLLATDILVGVQKAATQAGLIILPADLTQGGVTAAGAATVRYVNDTTGAIVPTAAESYVFRVLRNPANLPTVSLSTANAATAVAGSALRSLNDGANNYVPNLVTYGGAPVTAAGSIFYVDFSWLQEGGTYAFIDFVTDSPKLEAVLTGNGQAVRISVNGQLMTAQAGAYAAGTSTFTSGGQIAPDGNTYRLLIDFAGVRAFRSIRIEFVIAGVHIQGLQMHPTDTLIPAPRRGARVIVMDDSMGEATGATDATTGLPQIIAQVTGWDVWPCAYGGTGYIATNASPARSAAGGHLADATANAPDLIVWFLGINDVNLSGGAAIAANKAAIQAAALSAYQAIAAALPNVPQVVLGPEAGTGNQYQNANWIACRDAIKAAALAAGLPFGDPIGSGYLKGTGKVGATDGTGNADILVSNDGTHPSQAGHTAYAWVVASVIAAAING